MIRAQDNEHVNKFKQSSYLVESKFMSAQTLQSANKCEDKNSLPNIIAQLKKIIQTQENKLFRFELMLRNHKVSSIEMEKQLILEKQYGKQLKQRIQAYQHKNLDLQDQLLKLKKENAQLRNKIYFPNSFSDRIQNENFSEIKPIKIDSQHCTISKKEKEQLETQVYRLQNELKKLNQQRNLQQQEEKVKIKQKQQQLKYKVKCVLRVLDTCQQIFQNCESYEELLHKEILFLKDQVSLI